MTLPEPERFENTHNHYGKVTHTQARILLSIGNYSKLLQDIVIDLAKIKPISRTKIYENLLILCGKQLVKEGNYGWTSVLLGPEIEKLREEVEKYEKNIQSHSND